MAAGQAVDAQTNSPAESAPREGDVVEKEEAQEAQHLREDKTVYSDTSEWYDVVTMYLTVSYGNAQDSTNHTWAEVNTYDTYYYSDLGIDRYACEAILQVGDENGPVEGEFGYGVTVPNAVVMVRGQTSSRLSQKNYKIRIKDGMGTYKDMQTVPLNKYQSDDLRFRNKLVFDLMQPIPQMTSIRTQFVHLYVKDKTEGGSGKWEDYGLYTRLEQMNRTYLKNHGLDNKGYLYKVVNFEWYEYEPLMYLEGELDYDEGEFSAILKPKGDTDHRKLQEMLEAVNNYMIPIEDVVDQYFDVENFSYFLAYHILVGNYDVGARNLYLYSPLNSDKWYFLSWDCDDTYIRTEYEMTGYSEGGSWQRGMTQFMGTVLFNRIMRVEEYREALDSAVQDLRNNYLTPEKINERVSTCREVVLPYVHQRPDMVNWSLSQEEYDYICSRLASEIEMNYQYYLESLEKPWPFFVGVPEKTEEGSIRLHWDAAYDIDGEEITYTCILAEDPAFTRVLAEGQDLRIPEMICDVELPPGEYFIRVQATNASGYTQDCFDYYSHDTTLRGKRYGCMCFIVDEDGNFRAYERNSV